MPAAPQLGAGIDLAALAVVFVSVREQDKDAVVEPCRKLAEWGFELVATRGTAKKSATPGLLVVIGGAGRLADIAST